MSGVTTDLVPDDDVATLEELKHQVHEARFRVQRKANNELLRVRRTRGTGSGADELRGGAQTLRATPFCLVD